MTDSPSIGAEGPISFEIICDGTTLPDEYEVFSIRTRSEINRVSEALIVVGDGDPATKKFPVTDSKNFKPGTDVEIKAGYANRNKSIFKGVVTAIRLRIDNTLTPRLEITCRHKASVLLQGRRRTIYEAERKDSDLIKKVISDAGLTADVDATNVDLPETVRFGISDWDFIVNRSEVNGMLVVCTDKGLSITKPELKSSATLKVTYGEDLIAIDMQVSAKGQFSEFEASAWDPSTQKSENGTSNSQTSNGYGNLSASTLSNVFNAEKLSTGSSAFHDSSALQAYAKARASRADLALAQGWVMFQGNAAPQPNSVLILSGLGDRFSGNGFVGGVVHRIEAGTWKTEVQLGLPADWISDKPGFEAPAASALTSSSSGLVIGKVTKLNKDPKALSRIQVKIPEFDNGATPIWARLGSAYATNGSGTMFLPEVDDEVVIGFFNDNPSSPVILGSLHNPKAKPPEGFEEYDEKNHTKAIVSREKLKMVFNEEKKILSLETPGGNTIRFDDDAKTIELTDQHKNKITTDNKGITLDGAKDILIKAKGNVDIQAGGNVKITGNEVSADGSAAFKAKGGGTAEMTSGGTLKIQGAMVQIN